MKASQVLAALIEQFDQPDRWAVFPEQRCGRLSQAGGVDSQRIDLWVIDTWPSSHYARDAYEIKCSRSDYAAEIRNPTKRMLPMLLSNRFWFVVPDGLVTPAEVPPDCGLITVTETADRLAVRVSRPAPWRDVPPPTVRFLAELCRRVVDPQVAGFRGIISATRDAQNRARWAKGELDRRQAQTALLRSEVERLTAEIRALRAERGTDR